MMNLLVPLSLMVSAGETQFVRTRFVFRCRFQPVEGDGHQTTAVFVAERAMLSDGTSSSVIPMRTGEPCGLPRPMPVKVIEATVSPMNDDGRTSTCRSSRTWPLVGFGT